MNAVFSLSTVSKNVRNDDYGNYNIKMTYALFSLSVLQAKKIFNYIILETDDGGYDLLINKLKLPFDEVNLSLNNIDPIYKDL